MNIMESNPNYIAINKESWNAKTAHHLKSDFYDVEGFMQGQSSLNSIELDLLGDLKGKTVLHLQCHFGQDSLSISRLGAEVTGVDLSDVAIYNARQIAEQLELDATFICCDIYDLPKHLTEKFDVVFTSYGTIGWLPDLEQWGAVVSQFLKPGGKFVMVEFHPVVWMFSDDFSHIQYRYFNSGPIIETESGTYADRSASITPQNVTWNHALSEVFQGLIQNGLEIGAMAEYDYSPYNCFENTVEFEPKKYRIQTLGDKIPMVYSIVAQKKAR